VLGEIATAQDTGDYSDRGEVCIVASQPRWDDADEFTADDDGISL
jgi:hypothetical protein